mgnify:FL=1
MKAQVKNGKKLFLDILPPPDYLRMPALCLDLSDKSLKYMELRRKNGALFVRQFGIYGLEKGIIEGGEIKQKDKLISFLRPIREKLKIELVIASLPEEKVFLSRIKFPPMDESGIKEALSLQLEEYVPLLAAETIFDYDIINNPLENSGQAHLHLNLAAFPKNFVESYRDVFVGAGFIPAAFEMEAQAFARAVVPKEEMDSVMVIDFGRTRTTYAIVSRGKVQFATTVALAGEEIEKAFILNLKIDESQVEAAKRDIGLIKRKGNEKLFESLSPIVSVIKDEAAKQAAYWESRDEDGEKNEKISKIILCGGESTLAGLPEFLSYELKIKAELGNPWANVASFEDYIPEIEMRDSLAYSTVIGLALRQ